jgi:hypothetical protein
MGLGAAGNQKPEVQASILMNFTDGSQYFLLYLHASTLIEPINNNGYWLTAPKKDASDRAQ